MEFKRRMGEVEEVLVMHNFDFAWEKRTSSMNPKTAWITQIGHTFAFFATKIASECDPITKECQWMVVELASKVGSKEAHLM